MILGWVLVFVAIASGSLITYIYDQDAPFSGRICAGTCIGFAVLGLVGFFYASFLGLTKLCLVLSGTTLATLLVLLMRPQLRAQIGSDVQETWRLLRQGVARPDRRVISLTALYLLLAVILWFVCDHAVFERDGAIWTSAIHNNGDLPFHTSIIASFVHGQNFPPEHPQCAGARLTYPFIADFLVAMFMRAGASLTGALFLTSYILMLALVGILHHWAWKLTRNGVAAVFSLLLVLFSGGLGWWLLFDDVQKNGGSLFAALMHLSHEYTSEAFYGLRWGNLLDTMLVPQRSLPLGLPLAIIIWTLWWQALNGEEEARSESESVEHLPSASSLTPSMRRMLGAGAIAGLLPLVHTTSFIIIMMMAGCLALLFRQWRRWIAFFAVASLVALPQLGWLAHGTAVQGGEFVGWHFGWDKGSENFLWFWFKNTGLFIPLLVVAFVWKGRTPIVPRRLLLFSLPFLFCFIVPNLFRLTPWIWDSTKALIYWYLASVPLVALLLARLWRSGVACRAGAIVFCLFMTLAGALDVWRVVVKSSQWDVFNRDSVACAELIKKRTPPRALVLHAPINNHAVFLTGRRSLMSIPFLAWVHGLDYGSREPTSKRIYAGASNAEELLASYGVEYAVLGPMERSCMPVNESFFTRYPQVGETNSYRLYKIERK